VAPQLRTECGALQKNQLVLNLKFEFLDLDQVCMSMILNQHC